MNTINNKRQAGFTLIELMIVVAIVAILTIVATASYRNQVVRSNRAAAVGFMMELANKEEQYLLDRRNYATTDNFADPVAELGLAVPSEVSANYGIAISETDDTNAVPEYTITATPSGAQATDDSECGTLTLDSRGNKSASGGGSRCWK